jgi:DNA ligase 1
MAEESSPALLGELPQGRIGLGYAAVYAVDAPPAGSAALPLLELDLRLTELQAQKGAGSGARRSQRLGALFASATEPEQAFLRRLLVGERIPSPRCAPWRALRRGVVRLISIG